MGRAGPLVTMALFSLGVSVPVFSAGYLVKDLGVQGMSFTSALNNRGVVTGYLSDEKGVRGFIFTGRFAFPFLRSPSQAYGINDQGNIVGFFIDGKGLQQACIWYPDHFDSLGNGLTFSYALAINNVGQIVGGAGLKRVGRWLYVHPCLWEPEHGVKDIAPGALSGLAVDINDNGQIVGNVDTGHGNRAFLWERGIRQDLGPGYAAGINNRGEVVGYTSDCQGFKWSKLKGRQPLGLLGTVGAVWPVKINDAGQIVGSAEDSKLGSRAVIWDKNGQAIDLNSLIPPGPWVIFSAEDINRWGQIACRGWNIQSGGTHALLLTPIP